MINRIKSIIKENNLIKTLFIPVCVSILIAFILEVTVFNFRFYQTRFYEPVIGVNYNVSSNLEQRDYNIYEVVDSSKKPYIDVDIKNTKVENVYIDLWPKNDVFNADRIRFHFEVKDQGNPTGYSMPVNDYDNAIWQTKYTYVDLYGNCNAFRIVIDEGLSDGELLRIENISFNMRVPFTLAKKRVLCLALIFMLLYFLRPGSFVYKKRATDDFKGKKAIIIGVLLVQALLIFHICGMNEGCRQQIFESEHQFEMMAEALLKGQVYLLKEPPESLKKMDNPYSYQARVECGAEEECLYDVAYYKGHYYVYFGVGPILTIYAPYYLITGHHIPNYIVMFLIGVMTAGAWLLLLYEIIKKYFKDFSFALYIICAFLFTSGCGLTYVISRPSFYAVPMTLGLVSSLFGLAFWFKSVNYGECEIKNESGSVTGSKLEVACISPAYIFLGSLCMAFVAACRPQLLLGSFFSIFIFYYAVFKDRKLFSRKSAVETLCFIIPYVVIALGCMYYNYVRFESVFDFGANYNLTFNDMTYRGFRVDRLLYATLGFMFMPAKVSNHFPYFHPGEYISRYQGYLVDEQLFGGLFYNHLYLLGFVFLPKVKKYIQDKSFYIMCLIMPVFSIVIMVVDANMAGVINRYFVDFSWLVIIPFFVLFAYVITLKDLSAYRQIVGWAFYALAILSLIHMFFMIYGGDVNGLENNGIVPFQKMMHMIEFWN